MKKYIIIILIVSSFPIWAKNYDIDYSETVQLDRITSIEVVMDNINIISTRNEFQIHANIIESTDVEEITITLNGEMTSNKLKAVPRLFVNSVGSELKISLYPRKQTVFGLLSSGRAELKIEIPADFDGDIDVSSSWHNVSISNANIGDLSVDLSSGNITLANIDANKIKLDGSSGSIDIDNCTTNDDAVIDQSSGYVKITSLVSENEISIGLSSGTVEAEYLKGNQVSIEVSSGNIFISEIVSDRDIYIDSTSGTTELGIINCPVIEIDTTSGNMIIEQLSGGLNYNGTSGSLTATIVDLVDNIIVDTTSAMINLTLPENSSYNVDLSTVSGTITMDDQLLTDVNDRGDSIKGTVNGGGVDIIVECTSGRINIEVD